MRANHGKKKSKQDKAKRGVLFFCLGLLLFFVLMKLAQNYNYLSSILFPLWIVALGGGAVIGIAFAFFCRKKGIGTSASIGLFFLVTFIAFFLLGNILASVNHIFDPYEPECYTVTVEDLNSSRRRKGLTRYRLTVSLNGESLELSVPAHHYYTLEEGDLYVVEYHRGLFDEPYYIGALWNGDTK